MRNIILAMLAIAFVGPGRAGAQDVLLLKPGAKVRMTAPALGLSKRIGRVQELNGDTLIVLVDVLHKSSLRLEVTDVPLSSISKLEVSTGRRSHWLEGAGIGVLLGVVVGAASGDDSSDRLFASSAGEKAYLGALMCGLVGTGVGVLIKSDKWAEVPLERLRPRLIAGENGRVGVGVGVVLRF